MPDAGSTSTSGKAPISYQSHRLQKTHASNCGCSCKHFPHTWAAFRTFVTDNNNISGLYIACKNALHSIFFTVINPGRACMNMHSWVNCSLFYNRAVRSKAAFQDCNSSLGMNRIFKSCNNLFIELRVNDIEFFQVFPDSFAVNCKLVQMEFWKKASA